MKSTASWVTALSVLLAWGAVSCSAPDAKSAATPPASAGSSSPALATTVAVCLTAQPADWSTILSKTRVPLAGIVFFGTQAIDPANGLAYGYYHAGTKYGVASVELATGRVRIIANISGKAAGISWMSVSDPWLAWVQGDSQTNFGNWSIHVWNRLTHELHQIATSKLPDGSFLTGQLTFPVVGPGYVAWSEPVSAITAEQRVYQFATHETQVLDSGRLSSPVLAGPYLAWAKAAASGSDAAFVLVDAATLARAQTPPALSQPRPVAYLAGSPTYLVWTQGSSNFVVVSVRDHSQTTYKMPQDGKHAVQFPAIAGHFVIWWSGIVETVLDLSTGSAFDVPDGAAAGAGNTIVISGARGNVPTLSTLHISLDTTIPKCGG